MLNQPYTNHKIMNNTRRPLQILLLFSLAFSLPVLTNAQIQSNGTGGGVFTDDSTWTGDIAPAYGESWLIQSGDNVTSASNVSISSGSSNAINGSLTLASHHINIGTGGGDLSVTGTLDAVRMYTNPSSTDSSIQLSITNGGSVSVSNRLFLDNTNTSSTRASSVTLNGGSLINSSPSSYVGFRLYGADADDRATFSMIGNSNTVSEFDFVDLFNTSTGYENTATDINFKLAAGPAGAGAVTAINAINYVTLGGNAFEIDFTDVERPETGSIVYSTTLIDYGNSLNGTYGTLTSLGLGAGESATLFNDEINNIIGVSYTLAAIPEPSSFTVIAGFFALAVIGLRRRR